MHHRGQLMLMQRMLGIVPHLTREMQERMARFAAGRSRRRQAGTAPRFHAERRSRSCAR